MTTNRSLHVFLCHSKSDIKIVRELYEKLRAEPWIEPWLDEENLYPGQDWNLEIEKAIETTDVIIVCLSNNSITKEGYVQKEIKTALDFSDYKPEGTLYIMPVRLEECEPPRRLRPWQYADYFEGQRERGLQRLIVSLKRSANSLGLKIEEPITNQEEKTVEYKKPVGKTSVAKTEPKLKPVIETLQSAQGTTPSNKIILSNGIELLRVPAGKFIMGSTKENKLAYDNERPQHTVDIPYDYWRVWSKVSGARGAEKGPSRV